jgi:hypothetical protein
MRTGLQSQAHRVAGSCAADPASRNITSRGLRALAWGALAAAALCVGAGAQTPAAVAAPVVRDGSHDFDFEIGEWTTHLKRLRHALSGSTEWVEYQGRSSVHGLLDGRANVVELKVQGATGRIEGLSLRLYEPQSHQWTLNFTNITDGHLTAPMVGEFRDGVGWFYGPDSLGGRAILVRFVISRAREDAWRFEQAFSDDGGRSWEVNWIATDTRTGAGPS